MFSGAHFSWSRPLPCCTKCERVSIWALTGKKKSNFTFSQSIVNGIRSFPYCKDSTNGMQILFVNTLFPLIPYCLALHPCQNHKFPPGASAIKHFTPCKAEVLLTTLQSQKLPFGKNITASAESVLQRSYSSFPSTGQAKTSSPLQLKESYPAISQITASFLTHGKRSKPLWMVMLFRPFDFTLSLDSAPQSCWCCCSWNPIHSCQEFIL